MRGKALGMGLLVLIVSLSLIVFSGCGKKGEVRNQLTVTQAQKPSAPTAAGASREQAGGERAAQRQAGLKEQTLREQTLREESLRRGTEPPDRPPEAGRDFGGISLSSPARFRLLPPAP